MDPAEYARLSKVRNIGIAVRHLDKTHSQGTLLKALLRRILTVAKLPQPNESSSIPVASTPFTKYAAKML